MAIVPDQKWFIIRDGVRVALLERPQQEDMFWFSYEVTTLPDALESVSSPDFWRGVFDVEEDTSRVRVGPVFAGKVRPHAEGERVWLRGFVPYRSTDAPEARPALSWVAGLASRFRRSK
jgi:hypothetical protein